METREYLSSSVEYRPVGVGIPASSCTDAIGESEAIRFSYLPDSRFYRGNTSPIIVVKRYTAPNRRIGSFLLLGDYPEGTTTLAPANTYDTWNGGEWVI